MATWQFTVHLIPRTKLVQLFSEIPDFLDREIFDSINWWDEKDISQHYDSEIGSFLNESQSWSESIKIWGQEDSDHLSVLFDNGRVVEVEVRIDVRALNLVFVENVCSFARLCDCLLLTEGMALVEPEVDLLLHQIGKSNAFSFVSDPVEFLDKLRKES